MINLLNHSSISRRSRVFMEATRESSYYYTSIPYRFLFLLTLFTSVITVDLGELNLAIGDIFLIFLNVMIILSLKTDVEMDRHRKKWVQRVLIMFSIILFLSYVSIQSYIVSGYSVSRGITELIKLTVAVNYGVVFSIYLAYSTKRDLQVLLKWMILSGVLVAVTGILGSILFNFGMDNPFVMNGERAKGTLSDTNIMAIYILTLSPLVFLQYKKIKAFMIFLLFSASILATSSKAAIIVSLFLVIVFLLMLFLTNKLNKFFSYLFVISVILFSVYIVINNFTVFHLLSERLSELTSSDPSVVTTGRTDLWWVALSLMRNPRYLLLGIGYGSFTNYMVNVQVPQYLMGIKLVHNTYLSMLVETGLLNFMILSLISLYLLIKTVWIALITKKIKWIFILLSQLSLIIGMNQVNLQNNRYVYYMFIYYFFIINKQNQSLLTTTEQYELGS